MPNRFPVDKRIWIYRFLLERDGPNCQLCGKAPRNGPFSLEIDHKDNDKTNEAPENLQLAHATCNKKKEIAFSASGKRKAKAVVIELEGSPATRIVKNDVDYSQGSPEMKANSHFEMKYRQWVIAKIRADGSITKKEAINGGAELVGCSPATIGRYTDKLLSDNGPLQVIKDYLNNNLLIFKDDIIHALDNVVKSKKKKTKKKNKKAVKQTTTNPGESGNEEKSE